MFNFICGVVVYAYDNVVVLKSGDVGYEFSVSSFTLADCVEGESVQLYCYLKVSDDGLTLYGFSQLSEKKMFMRLTSISGIGPSIAIKILSGMSCDQLASAIYSGDVKSLMQIKGIGKKGAERLILELKDKVAEEAKETVLENTAVSKDKSASEAVAVLVSLGLSYADAEKRVDAAMSLGASTAEEIIAMSFKIK